MGLIKLPWGREAGNFALKMGVTFPLVSAETQAITGVRKAFYLWSDA